MNEQTQRSIPSINEASTIVDDSVVSKKAVELSIDLITNEASQPQRPRNNNLRVSSKYFKGEIVGTHAMIRIQIEAGLQWFT